VHWRRVEAGRKWNTYNANVGDAHPNTVANSNAEADTDQVINAEAVVFPFQDAVAGTRCLLVRCRPAVTAGRNDLCELPDRTRVRARRSSLLCGTLRDCSRVAEQRFPRVRARLNGDDRARRLLQRARPTRTRDQPHV